MTQEGEPDSEAAPADEETGAPMHIHKPKAPASFSEFLAEIGVIVVGIVIALGGEQGVEALHWRHEVHETRQALNEELAGDLGVVDFRRNASPCIDRRLAELKTLIAAHAAGRPSPVLKGPVAQPQFPHIRTNVWRTALASQTVAHMPLEMRLRYSALYDSLDWFGDKTQAESDAWARLTALDDGAALGAEDWAAVRLARAQAQALAEKVEANVTPYRANGSSVRPLIDKAAELGVAPDAFVLGPASKLQMAAFCKPVL